MGVRLAYFNKPYNYDGNKSLKEDHNELINRDIPGQHPMYAIIGLQEVLNIIENLLTEHVDHFETVDEQITEINEDREIIHQALTDTNIRIDEANTVDSVQDTSSVDLDYDQETNTLQASVKLFGERNRLVQFPNGLFVAPDTFVDTSTVQWTYEGSGCENLKNIFYRGTFFCHAPRYSDEVAYADERQHWNYSDERGIYYYGSNDTAQQRHAGFISQFEYRNVKISAIMSSTNSDDDAMTLVFYAYGDNGEPHTLTFLIARGYGSSTGVVRRIIYDYLLPTQEIIVSYTLTDTDSIPGNSGYTYWNQVPNGIRLYFQINQNTGRLDYGFTAFDDPDGTITNKGTTVLSKDWFRYFANAVHVGIGVDGQGDTKVTDFKIEYIDEEYQDHVDRYSSIVRLSSRYNNGISRESDGLWTEKFNISSRSENAIVQENDESYFVQEIIPTPNNELFGNIIKYTAPGHIFARAEKGYKEVTQTSHGFTVGHFIYFRPVQNKYFKAMAIDDYDVNVVGMVTRVIDADTFEYMWSGFFQTGLFTESNGYDQGMPLYLSSTVAGAVTQLQPDISKTVGYPVENSGIVINLERGIQYNNEANIGDTKMSTNTFNIRTDGFIRVVPNVKFKLSLVRKLVDTVSSEFKSSYLIIDETMQTMEFKNTEQLKSSVGCESGIELFIKAF